MFSFDDLILCLCYGVKEGIELFGRLLASLTREFPAVDLPKFL
jgi:hypothetical protein